MEIKVNRSNLLSAVQKVAQYSRRVSSMEALKWMRFDAFQDANHNGLMLTCSQIEITVSVFVPASIQGKLDPFCVDAKKITKVLRATQGSDIAMIYDPESNSLVVKCECGTLTLLCEKAKEFITPDMERWQGPEEFTPAGELIRLANRVGFCASKDEARPVLQGVCFGADSVAATDGFRVGFIERNPTGFEGIIPMAAVTAMHRLITEEAEYFKDQNKLGLYIRDANVRIYTYLIDGHFPEYKAIVPHKRRLTARFTAKELRDALKFAQVVYQESGANAIRMEVDESGMTITSNDSDFGDTRAQVKAEVEFEEVLQFEKQFLIAFNGEMLLQYLYKTWSSDVRVDLLVNNAPALFSTESDHLKYLVMPMHLG